MKNKHLIVPVPTIQFKQHELSVKVMHKAKYKAQLEHLKRAVQAQKEELARAALQAQNEALARAALRAGSTIDQAQALLTQGGPATVPLATPSTPTRGRSAVLSINPDVPVSPASSQPPPPPAAPSTPTRGTSAVLSVQPLVTSSQPRTPPRPRVALDTQGKLHLLNSWFAEKYQLEYSDLRYDASVSMGHGSFGSVRTATLRFCKTDVAVKLIKYTPRAYGSLYHFHRAVAREYDILQLSSDAPYVVPLVGVCFKTLDQAVLVMEKYDCQLGDYLRTNVKLNRWSVARQLVNIYRYLHYSLKVVHNDIKMDNLLVRCDSGRLGLVDFGLSGNLMKGDIFQEVSSGYRRSRTTGALVRWTPRHYWSNSKCQTCHQDKSVDLFAIAYVLLSVVTHSRMIFLLRVYESFCNSNVQVTRVGGIPK